MMFITLSSHSRYNVRDERISGQGHTYAYDDIGNRTEAEGRDYVVNNLNQYTAIDAFALEYDLDGNQTKVQTETGVSPSGFARTGVFAGKWRPTDFPGWY